MRTIEAAHTAAMGPLETWSIPGWSCLHSNGWWDVVLIDVAMLEDQSHKNRIKTPGPPVPDG